MKKLIHLLFLLPLIATAQVDVNAFYGTNVARAYGTDTLVGFKAFNTNGAGLAGFLSIAGTDSAAFGVNTSGQAAIQSGLSKNAIRLYNPVGIPNAPVASAMLDITSTERGFLCPRMTTAQRDAISSPATGLMVYNTTTSAFNYYNAGWQTFGSGGITVGTTTITGGATGLILYQKSDGTVQESEFKYVAPGSTYAPAIITVGSGISHVIKIVNGGGRQLLNLEEGVALGELASVYTSFNTYKVAIGQNATVSQGQSTAIGAYSSCAVGANSMALGYAATTTAANQCVIGAAAAAGGAGVYNNVYFNGVTHTAPANVTLNACGGNAANGAQMTIQGGAGSGTDKNAGGLTLTSGISTGTGTGSVFISTPTPGASGTGTNGLNTRLTIDYLSIAAALPIKLSGYTVANLPAGSIGMTAYVTDATAPTYLGALTGGGAVATPVFYNGSAWVSY